MHYNPIQLNMLFLLEVYKDVSVYVFKYSRDRKLFHTRVTDLNV